MVTLSVSGLVVDCLIPPLPTPSPCASPSPSPVPSPCPALAGCLVIWLAGCLLGYPQSSATFPRPTQPRSLDCPTLSFSLPLSHSVCRVDECYSHFAVGYSNVALSRCQLPALMMHSHLCTAPATATKTTTAAALACFAALQLT